MERVNVIKDICQQLGLTQVQGSWIKTLGQHLGVAELPGGDDYEQRVFTAAISNNEVVPPLPIFGPFGIADEDGFYNYFPTLQDAITVASAGQVVEVFSNYVEGPGVTVTLKDGVIINGNGHSYTTTDETVNGFDGTGVKTSILNYNFVFNLVERVQNFAQGFELTNCDIDFNGSKIKSIDTTTVESTAIRVYNSIIKNLYVDTTDAIRGEGILGDNTSILIDTKSIGNYDTIIEFGKVINCYSETTVGGIYTPNGDVINTVSYSDADAITANRIFNSYGQSTSGNGLTATNIYNSVSESGGVVTVY